MKKKQSYKDYLRKSFIQYAMVLFGAMALLVTGFFAFNYYVTVLRQNEASNSALTGLFSTEYERYKTQADTLCTDKDLLSLMQSNASSARAHISSALYAFSNEGVIHARFVVCDADGKVLLSNYTAGNEQVFEESLFLKRVLSRAAGGQEVLSLLCDVEVTADQSCAYSFARAVFDQSGAFAGCLFLNMRTEDMEEIADAMSEDFLLLDRYKNVIFASFRLPHDPGEKLPTRRFTQDIGNNGIHEIRDERMYVRGTHLADGDIDIYTLTSVGGQLLTYRYAALFLLLMLIVVGILMALMTRLYTGIGERSVGELTRELEVKNLEEQFNPHFVFNVMESVYFQIDEDPKKAQEMLMAFSTLMRYSINHGHSRVRLETDIDYLGDFLMLQKIRYNQLLSYRFNIPDELLDCMVPKLLLQPVIENSIRHGFIQGQPLQIDISARCEKETLIFEIRDNGAGITEEKLAEIRDSFQKDIGDETLRHVGLYNVEQVLKRLYGKQYGLTINSVRGEGTVAVLTMPYEVEEDDV